MRIAYVSVDPGVSVFGPHGASVHIQEIVREFAAQGHEVTIFTTRRGNLRHRLLLARSSSPEYRRSSYFYK